MADEEHGEVLSHPVVDEDDVIRVLASLKAWIMATNAESKDGVNKLGEDLAIVEELILLLWGRVQPLERENMELKQRVAAIGRFAGVG